MTPVHNSPYGGQWYPESADALSALLDEKFESSRARTGDAQTAGVGFVVPHAGPAYSGTVAAAVYRSLARQKARRIILLAFPHHGMLRGVAAPDVHAIGTPLGALSINRQFAREFRTVPESRLCDHSLEIQIPFLQHSVPDAVVTPLYVGHLTDQEREETAAVLAAFWEPGTVLLASSDFTHYGPHFDHVPFPADRYTGGRLRDLDFEYIEAVGSLDANRFIETVERHKGTVCGIAPIALLLATLRRIGGSQIYPETLDYQTSGELTGDWNHSVSYAALGFYPATALALNPSDGAILLDSAAATLRHLREHGDRSATPAQGGSAALDTKRGAFVSLHRGEELLGCLGNIVGRRALREDIPQLALSAALDDPRFRPAAAQTGPIDIEISLLTPLRRIYRAADLEVGRHGAMLTLAGRSGLLLPQVAAGREWSPEDFLRALERKSGLWKDAWRDPKARLYVFEAQIFSRSNAVPNAES